MGWARGSDGVYRHTGTTRDAIRFDDPIEDIARIEYRFAKTSDECTVLVKASQDTQTGMEIGISSESGASTSKLTIRRRDNNTLGTILYEADHNIPADTPYTLIIDLDGAGFSATISTTGVTEVRLPTEGNASFGDLAENTGHAFASDVDGASVLEGGTRPVDPVISTVNAPLLAGAFGNGGFYAREVNDTAFRLIRAGCFSATDVLSVTEFKGKFLILAYNSTQRMSRSWKVDVAGNNCVAWSGTNGTLPGATGSGTTTASVVNSLFGRVYLAVGGEVYTSAADSFVENGAAAEEDWEVDLAEPGSAKVYPIGEGHSRGLPIIAMAPGSPEAMLIFKSRGVYALIGDPTLGQTQVVEIDPVVGISGPRAITKVGVGTYYVHTPEGAYIVSLSGAIPLSKFKLREHMDIGRNNRDAYHITVHYDQRDALVYFFITQKNTSPAVARKHPVLDLQTSEFLLDEYPEALDPICAAHWDGRMLMGDRDGYVRWLAPFGESDDGYAFTSKYTALLQDIEGSTGAIQLGELSLQLGTQAKYRPDTQADANGVVVTVYGGQTAEDAILPNRRTRLCGPMMFMPGRQTHMMNVSDHAIAIELTGIGNGFDWFCEEGEASVTASPIGQHGQVVATRSRKRLCRAPANGGVTTPNVPPVANAGADQNVTDTDNDGEELIRLDGSRSTDSDGYITAYRWTDESGNVISTNAVDFIPFVPGVHVVTLRVTDDDGATDTDTCTITVNEFTGGPTDPPPKVGGGPSSTGAPSSGDGVVTEESIISDPLSVGQIGGDA